MKASLVLLLPVVAALTGCATGAPAPREAAHCDGPPVTYVADVRPILERRCLSCHAGDGVAAEEHDFSGVATLRAQRQELADDVSSHAMPPPSQPGLDDGETSTLLRWASCGALER
jgi:uncharacterized membrane protein